MLRACLKILANVTMVAFATVAAFLALVALVALPACGSGDDDGATTSPDAAVAGGPDAAAGDPTLLVGKFVVELVAADDTAAAHTTVLGTIYDGAQPESIVWETAATSGDCVLYTPRVPFCSTPCGSGNVCVEDDTCAPYATKQVVGTVHVTGLATTSGGDAFDMDPIARTYQPTADVGLAYPPFTAGDAVRFAAAGSDFAAAFSVEAEGIAPLVLTSADPALARDQPIVLAWTASAASPASPAKLAVKLDISHHGGSRGKIECLAPDSGSLSIDAQLVNPLLDLGAAGYPTIIVARQLTGSTTIAAGRVELELRSEVERPVSVPGLQSCTDDTDCDPGEVCRDDLTCG
jgi:hypothetical protein